METIVNTNGNVYEIKLTGRIDSSSASSFEEALAPVLAAEKADVAVDCSELEYTSSQGLRLFLMLQKSVSGNGGKLVLKNMTPLVREVFNMTGFSKIIEID